MPVCLLYFSCTAVTARVTENCFSRGLLTLHQMKPHLQLLALFITIAACSPAYATAPAAAVVQSHMEQEPGLPGIQLSPQLRLQLQRALERKGQRHSPRTEHLLPDGRPRYTNRLILEESPYLLQHAHNPVNWFPWGEEALARARQEGKPLFLSIGYSTCHWCHVMERESFDNPEIARFLNEHFIAIKVDREQHPDIDATYMTAVRLMTGQGGWPMSSFLTPQGRPFFGGTYFPPEHFTRVLHRIKELWNTDNDALLQKAARISEAVARANRYRDKAGAIDNATLDRAARSILAGYDELQGGFTPAPKFPNETLLLLLLHKLERQDDEPLRKALLHTLDTMAQGGIHDQVGGGFHRYSIDNAWLVPHFEKMLYNQALLGRVYLKAWQISGEQRYARIARQTLEYVIRDMMAPGGAFFSATDADSEEEEGRFFLWSEQQLRAALTPAQTRRANDLLGITPSGNFEGSNILHLPEALDEYARRMTMPLPTLLGELDSIRERLYRARELRVHPDRDEKIISAWNGMMITTLALAGEALGEPRYLEAAEQAAEYIWRHHLRDSNGLWRISLNGAPSTPASQEDYAYVGEALVTLFDITGEQHWLDRSRILTDSMLQRFRDREQGLFYMSESENIASMPRFSQINDGAMPSGNAVALRLLNLMEQRTGNPSYGEHADTLLAALASTIKQQPAAHAYMLLAADERLQGETGPHRFAGRGAVSVHAYLESENQLTLQLNLRPGWHINSHKPANKNLIPTTLSLHENSAGWSLEQLHYPAPVRRRLGFAQEPLELYEGDIRISARLHKSSSDGAKGKALLRLQIQSCSDELCLLPEVLLFNAPDSTGIITRNR